MRWIRAVVVALPGLVLAGIGLEHPPVLTPATAHHWWTMHVLLIPLFPLLALALVWLLRGERGPLAWLARIAGYRLRDLLHRAGRAGRHRRRAGGGERRPGRPEHAAAVRDR